MTVSDSSVCRPEERQRLEKLYHSLAGALSVSFETVVNYPLDTLKTRYQLIESKGTLKTPNVFAFARDIVTREPGGFKNLYRGICPTLLMQVPRGALKFGLNHSILTSNVSAICRNDWITPFLSGFIIGAIDGAMVFPFEFVKVRMQSGNAVNKSFRSSLNLVGEMLRHDSGVHFTGFKLTVIRNALWHTMFLGSLNTLPKHNSSGGSNALNGLIGGALGSVLSSPFDVCKSRVQNGFSLFGSISSVFKNDGLLGFYRGFVPKVIRLGTGGALIGWAFDRSLSFFHFVDTCTVLRVPQCSS